MPLTATTSRNPCAIDTYDGSLAGIPIGAGEAINQGDIVVWDPALNSGNGGLRTPAVLADMAISGGGFIGIAGQMNPVASLNDALNTLQIFNKNIVRLKTTSGETYKMFTEVYWNDQVDVQTITTAATGGRTRVGYAILPAYQTMNGVQSITGTTNGEIQVWLVPAFPLASI
jgi:hypothetical protein